MRDHEPLVINQFNGLWARGEIDSCPLDHFTEFINYKTIQYGFQTRDGLDILDPVFNQANVVRIYTYNIPAGDGFLVLDTSFHLRHIIVGVSNTIILTITNMTDFKFININTYAYITPQRTGTALTDFVYVYRGDGNPARKVGGNAPTNADGALAVASGAAGSIEIGYHVFATVYLTNTGFFTQLGPDTLAFLNFPGATKANLTNIPVSPSSAVIARYIVATHAIAPADWIGDTRGQTFYWVPGGVINDNVTTSLTVDFFDSALIDNTATDLISLFSSIPCCNDLALYHGRLVYSGVNQTNPQNGNVIYVSNVNQPEAVDSVSGIMQTDNNGLGIELSHTYRDILYTMKINKCVAWSDNNDVPSSWPNAIIDEGVGAGLHGLCQVSIYLGGTNIEFLIMFDFSGFWIFNGTFNRPELSWKIRDLWAAQSQFNIAWLYEIYNDPINYRLYINVFDQNMVIVGDYSNGLEFKSIKWQKWTFSESVKTITLFGTDNKLIVCTSSGIHYIHVGTTFDNLVSGAVKIPNPTAISALLGD